MPQRTESRNSNKYLYKPLSIAALFTTANRWEQTMYPTADERIHKAYYAILFSLKKANSHTCSNTDES